jgi:ribulose 1,5-bisphosphate synthetase/thiazole synthase
MKLAKLLDRLLLLVLYLLMHPSSLDLVQVDVAIVGGGPGGMAAAVAISKYGCLKGCGIITHIQEQQ